MATVGDNSTYILRVPFPKYTETGIRILAAAFSIH